jgi:hypothetical protein
MKAVASSLIMAFKSQLHPKMLALLLWPMLIAIFVWLGAAFFFWHGWASDLSGLLQETSLQEWMARGMLAAISGYLVSFILVMLLLPAIYVTALVITAVFAMPIMVEHVASRDYPDLERKTGGNTAGSVTNSIVAVSIFLVLWLITLPLWLLSAFALIIPIALSAYLNQRLFRYDALSEHASAEEFDALLEHSTGKLYLLGIVAGLLQYVPLLNLFSTTYIALAFIHLCLSELRRQRT